MKLSPKQQGADRAVKRWLDAPGVQQVFSLAGYAGSGKTTLVKRLVENVEGRVVFCAPTGKAAYVLQQKGCQGASTIHSLIYTQAGDGPTQAQVDALAEQLTKARAELAAHVRPEGHQGVDFQRASLELAVKRIADQLDRARLDRARKGPRFRLNPASAVVGAKLIVVDEGSMVDERVGRDLLSFGIPVLALWDPAQLPPVGGSGFLTEGDPDYLLDEVHRQAEDSPILRLATDIRQGRGVSWGRYGDGCEVIRYGSPGLEEAARRADQILVGRNRTRTASNVKMRRLLGRTSQLPELGDRLVCLRNDHEVGVLNGSLWTAEAPARELDEGTCWLSVKSLDGMGAAELIAWRHEFEGRGDELSGFVKRDAQEFAYGYALTVHKSQGSQWDNVIVFDESAAFGEHAWRHLYTAVTRAAKTLTLVR